MKKIITIDGVQQEVVAYKCGSSMLGLQNCHDVDWLVMDDKIGDRPSYRDQNGEEFFFRSTATIHRLLNFRIIPPPAWNFCTYQFDADIINQKFPIEFHVLDHKTDVVWFLNQVTKKELCNFSERIAINGLYCSKKIYHIAYLIFIMQNNSVYLNNEQKEIIQKIHDLEMPISYVAKLKEMIKNLGGG